MMDRRERDYARDMRRRDREMSRDMRRRRNSRGQFMSDRAMGDGRNPYGSRGGYVVSNRGMDYGRDYNDMRGADYRQSYDRGDYGSHGQSDYARNDYGYERNREYRGSYGNTPFHMTETQRYDHNMHGGDYGDMRGRDYGDYGDMRRGGRRDYGYDMRMGDYGKGGEKLSKDDIEDWVEKLMHELSPEEKEMFKMDKVLQRAKEMGIEFGREFDENEFYCTVLMCYTDYKKTIGKGNLEGALSLSKDFLLDEDSPIKGGEKLATYYDEIICG